MGQGEVVVAQCLALGLCFVALVSACNQLA